MDGSRQTSAVDYGPEEAAMQAYLRDGERRAAALGNRGPIRFTPTGELASRHRRGLLALRLLRLRGRARGRRAGRHRARPARHPRPPAGREGRGARRQGPAGARRRLHGAEPALGASRSATRVGGTDAANGRHPVKMFEPAAAGRCAEGGRLPHPGLAAVLRGRAARLRPSRAAGRRRRDQRRRTSCRSTRRCGSRSRASAPRSPGTRTASTHWDSPDWDQGIHGFNFMAPALRLHRGQRRVGRAGLAQAGQGRHQGAGRRRPAPSGCPTPCRSICAPGDVAITNRQALHGSFANTSPDWRVTINFGFHRRTSVLGVRGRRRPQRGRRLRRDAHPRARRG